MGFYMRLNYRTYQAAARKLRTFADQLDARCKPMTPREKASLTSAVFGASRYSKRLADMHRRATEKRNIIHRGGAEDAKGGL